MVKYSRAIRSTFKGVVPASSIFCVVGIPVLGAVAVTVWVHYQNLRVMERREAKEENKIYSSVVCFLLDNLGYNDDIRRFREREYEKRSDLVTNALSNIILNYFDGISIRCIGTGSKLEGASLPLQGDIDVMQIFEDVVCVEESSGITQCNTLKTVYSDNVPPGYVRVAKGHLDDTKWMEIVCSDSYLNLTPDGLPYISSTVFHNFCKQAVAIFSMSLYDFVDNDQFSYSGPACTKTMQFSWSPDVNIMIDIVVGIYFFSPIYLPRWAARTRHYCWPSSDVINEISTIEGYIVPVGSIEGENPDLEWRISYVTAENKLISNLNTIQFKLYIILKMIAKELIYPDFPVISSYVVKNIVLWVCELNPQSLFTVDLLFDQVRKCLLFMRTCLQNNHLPNYIIPERNLISCRINVLSKRHLILRVNNLLNDGRAIFSRLSIFKKHSQLALILAPSSVYFFGKTRDRVEKLWLFQSLKFTENFSLENLTSSSFFSDTMFKFYQHESYLPLILEIFSLLFPEIFTFINLLEMFSSVGSKQFWDKYNTRLNIFLS